jgi:hypothetical protein
MPENKVSIILEAADKTKEAFNSVKSSSEGLLSSLKSHWAEFTAAGASIYGMIKGVQSFVSEAGNAEQIESRMAFQIDAVGIKYKEVKTAIDAFANSIQNSTRFSSEMAQKGLGQMMMYTADLGQAFQATKLAMDMSTQTGMDLEMALRYVGMAMNGDIEVLSRMNPAFRHLVDTLDVNATQADKAAYGFKKLNELFSGASQKDLTTYEGKLAHLGNTWTEFKKTLGGELLPVLDEVLDRLTRIGKAGVITAGGGTEKERLVAQVSSLEAQLLGLQVEQPYVSEKGQVEIMAKIEAAKKRIIEIDKDLAGAEKKVEEASAGAVAGKQWDEFLVGLHKLNQGMAETPKYVTELQKTFNELNVTSSIDLVGMANAARTNMELIKKAFSEGKASSKDYQNALASATEAMKKLVAPDITKSMADLQKKYEEGAKAISRDDPEFRKKIEALADSINEEMKKIQGPSTAELEAQFSEYSAKFQQEMGKLQSELAAAGAEKIKIKIDTVEIEGSFNEVYNYFKNLKEKIESNPIIVKSSGGGAGGGSVPPVGGYGGSWDANLNNKLQTLTNVNIDFTATGMSPKMALGDALKKLVDKFGTIQDTINALQVNISFEETSIQLKSLEKQMDQYKAVQQGWQNIINSGWASINMMTNWKNPQADVLAGLMSDLQDQIDVMKKQQALDVLQGVEGSFQTGIGYVPKTGKYILHKGEKVSTTNQVSMGGQRISITVSESRNPRATAQEIVKALKYQLSGDLETALKKIR